MDSSQQANSLVGRYSRKYCGKPGTNNALGWGEDQDCERISRGHRSSFGGSPWSRPPESPHLEAGKLKVVGRLIPPQIPGYRDAPYVLRAFAFTEEQTPSKHKERRDSRVFAEVLIAQLPS